MNNKIHLEIMTNLYRVIFILFSQVTVFAETAKLPDEIQELEKKRNTEVIKIDTLYVKALKGYRQKYTKDGDLVNAVLIQDLIDERQGAIDESERQVVGKLNVLSRETLLKGSWLIEHKGGGKEKYHVIFGAKGVVTDLETKKKIWKWKIVDDGVFCNWYYSGGWVRFYIDSDSGKWSGTSKGGTKYTMVSSLAE